MCVCLKERERELKEFVCVFKRERQRNEKLHLSRMKEEGAGGDWEKTNPMKCYVCGDDDDDDHQCSLFWSFLSATLKSVFVVGSGEPRDGSILAKCLILKRITRFLQDNTIYAPIIQRWRSKVFWTFIDGPFFNVCFSMILSLQIALINNILRIQKRTLWTFNRKLHFYF